MTRAALFHYHLRAGDTVVYRDRWHEFVRYRTDGGGHCAELQPVTADELGHFVWDGPPYLIETWKLIEREARVDRAGVWISDACEEDDL